MKKIFFMMMAFVFVLVCSQSAMAQKLEDNIKNDPNVRIGKLDNGMTYYIRHNEKPAGRVEFRLAVNAGSNQEDDDQQGLAHFTEHMAFNGIEGYPHNEMIDKLQKIGVIFGLGINAYTSFDETVFEITMPTDDQKNIDFGINILYGWAHGLLYDTKEIDAERGVISEEWRMGNGASDRMQKKWFPVAFNNSLYAKRLPIGLIEIIQGFKPEVIKRFYNDWYRPDLQAVIVVGDVNVDAIEKQIKEKFGPIPAKENPRPKIIPSIDNNVEPLVCVCTDKEAGSNEVMMIRKFPHQVVSTVKDYRDYMITQLYNMMFEERLNDLQQDPNCPAVGMQVGYSDFIGDVDAYMLVGMAKENKINETAQLLLREDYRVLKHGFLETELQRAKDALMEEYERAVKEVDKTESNKFAREYVANYLHHDPIPGAKRELNYAKKFLQDITLDEVNALAKKWITDENFVAVVMAPEKAGVKVPTENELLSIVKDKSLANVEPYVDNYKEQEIIEKETLTPGKVVSKRAIQEVGATEYTLSNGIKVIAKKTDYKNDEILFSATSPGGYSLYNSSDVPSLAFASDFIDRGGINEMDFASLQKKLKGKKIGLAPTIGPISEGLSGTTSPDDLELFMQYVNAFFTHPRIDTTSYSLVMDETREQVKMIQSQPMYKFIGGVISNMSNDDPYMANLITYDEEFLSKVDFNRAVKLYQERFANPADFTFVFTGNFDEVQLVNLMETYLGSMKTSDKKETFRTEVFKKFPTESAQKEMFFGADDAASWLAYIFSEPIEWSEENELMVNVINDALEIEALEIIREKLGGTYSPMVQVAAQKYPNSSMVSMVLFSCDPKRVDKLGDAVVKILQNFCKKGPKEATLAKVKEQMLRSIEEDQQTNRYWHNYMIQQITYGDSMDEVNQVKQNLDKINVAAIVSFMQKNFKTDHHIRLAMYPESGKPGKKSKK